ncbi:MAG: helix-turn-helix domain-containing protein [Defluviitaleaceae bacterium]|nr:helix-turn-helix domain-containing protein [Defluviitaleaceae bacterium]
MTVGEKLKARRKELGMTQLEVSTVSGVHVVQIRQYETGAKNPKIDTIRKIAVALNISFQHFLDLEDDDFAVFRRLFGDIYFDSIKYCAEVCGMSVHEYISECFWTGASHILGEHIENNPELVRKLRIADVKELQSVGLLP